MTMVPVCYLNQVIEHPAEQDYPGPCTLDDYGSSVMLNQVIKHPGPCTLGDYGSSVMFKPSD